MATASGSAVIVVPLAGMVARVTAPPSMAGARRASRPDPHQAGAGALTARRLRGNSEASASWSAAIRRQ